MRVIVDPGSGTWMDAGGCVLIETPMSVDRFEELLPTIMNRTDSVDRVVSVHEVLVAMSDAEVPDHLAREIAMRLTDV